MRAIAASAAAAQRQEAEQQRREDRRLRPREHRERKRRSSLQLAAGDRALDHDDEPERDERLGEEIAPVGQQVGPQHRARRDERGRRARRAEPAAEEVQRARERAGDERHDRRRRGGLEEVEAAGDRPERLREQDRHDRQQREQQPVLGVVRHAVMAGDAELRRHRQRRVVHDRLRHGEHRAAVEDRDLRLPDEDEEEGHSAAQTHRDAAVVARSIHRGRIYPTAPRGRAVGRRRTRRPPGPLE